MFDSTATNCCTIDVSSGTRTHVGYTAYTLPSFPRDTVHTSIIQAEALRKELAMVKDKAKVYISRLNEVGVSTAG